MINTMTNAAFDTNSISNQQSVIAANLNGMQAEMDALAGNKPSSIVNITEVENVDLPGERKYDNVSVTGEFTFIPPVKGASLTQFQIMELMGTLKDTLVDLGCELVFNEISVASVLNTDTEQLTA